MNLLLFITVFLLPPLVATLEKHSPLESVPRKHVLLHGVKAHRFHQEGVLNYTSMLLMEDLGLLVLGAREAVFALDLHDISKGKASVRWEAMGDPVLCKNYIMVLHRIDAHRIYVCGTYAFRPKCVNMTYVDGKLTLEQKVEDGTRKGPIDPDKRSASILVDDKLYSATFKDFHGKQASFCRSGICNTENRLFNDPTFVSMSFVPESQNSPNGDDDKIYLFFSEEAVECKCNSNLLASRVARVCKGDQGGNRVLQKKWTSFLKARIDCPVQKNQWSNVIEGSYLLCDPQQQWQNCVFYAIFRPQQDTDGPSAVCGYSLSDISRVFSEGNYKTEKWITSIFSAWHPYDEKVPSPRPGACITNTDREQGINDTRDQNPDTHEFVKRTFLMDEAIQPIGGKPLLLRRGATFNHIIVTQTTAADGQKYNVMFVSTEDGTVLKSVNYNGEIFTIEEMQIFQPGVPIRTLTFSSITNQLYAGSHSGVAQIPLASCDRSSSCVDCVLSRDPHCGWDKSSGKCVALTDSTRQLIQSVRDGNANLCPNTQDSIQTTEQSTWSGGNLKLRCPLTSNLATVSWERDNHPLKLSDRLQQLDDGLLILNASGTDSGQYKCLSVERSKTGQFSTSVARFNVKITARTDSGMMAAIQGLGVVVALLACLIGLLFWTIYKQQQFPSGTSKKKDSKGRGQVSELH
ncbi:semaphorin-4E-like isoform X2 [Cynoglossus semilaevis]|uniref:semaphorin-4E-like isoform X2 n=1 Tax=Cynoglossus semilaevis TaxID=244447 RepID=UPI0004981242|nr:semaphorin-4E-like isoform X2 [Cynoglossus semilaevis]